MQFHVRRWPVAGAQGWALAWLDDRLDLVCSLAVPEDAIPYWHGAWSSLAHEDAARIGRALDSAGDLFQLEVDECPLTAVRALYGLLEYLQATPLADLSHVDGGSALIREFVAERFDFGCSYGEGSTLTQIAIDTRNYQSLASGPPSAEGWLAALYKWVGDGGHSAEGADFVESAVASYEFLYAAARQHRDEVALDNFVAFSRALAERLEKDERYQPYRRHLDDLYEVIARHERDLNVARDGLLRLLAAPGSVASKWQRLHRLIHGFSQSSSGRGGGNTQYEERTATLTGLIADHCLESYDLPRAVAAWRLLSLPDSLLGNLLMLMDRPGRLLGLHGAAFVALTVLASLQARMPQPPLLRLPHVGAASVVHLLGGLLLLLLFAGPASLGVRIAYSLLRRRLYYVQIVLPRMLAAIVVGLSVLMLDDFPWRTSLGLSLLPLLLLTAGVYFFSYLYILLDVYQTVRFEPAHSFSHASSAGSSFGYATAVALRVFAMGIMQSLLATLLISGLVLPFVFADPVSQNVPPWENSALGWIAFPSGPGPVTFVFVPALVLLWTGMALFIGAFVQLLWQDRRAISPVRG